ncbi:Rieske (2Fe-2S) protein [Variovorax saccharolyticus]|uniref:Rieske (2Fe-2S) protein n=1 Tax=Variovorax saccharolyticus TaxID=3053516 RepID=UPI0025750D45|nr:MULTISPECIES: Rieske 2Fe-2S domain-containing protein [unclassified Variovorax]MDM0022377.1 nitrite reductase (NAD(P)H) small subunit [Variovorax sp. J22R187]MDM0029033.1 nitrite reductase (NAD(P)H) small subunit [Variovorax sp. J31P216]
MSTAQAWTDLLAEHDLTERGRCFARLDGHEIALFRIEDAVHAIADSCPHAGASLARGALKGTTIQCPAHGLRFDLASGCIHGAGGGLAVRTYPVRIHAGRVEVDLGGAVN